MCGSGGLDFMLLMPVNARFLISLRHVDFGAFVNATSAVAVAVYAAGRLHLRRVPGRFSASWSSSCSGSSLHYSVMYAPPRQLF
jgi:ABC-type uncharacterized transport system permease subunit